MSKLFRKLTATVCSRNCSYKSVRRPNITVNQKVPSPQTQAKKPQSHELTNHLRAKILATGPITVAEYMKEVLTNPISGYYMNRDVFGKEGDFITSPEISQIFGELVTIWLLSEWQKIGSPAPFQIVELGPGRGTLARDVIKVMSKFLEHTKFSIHFVEISPFLSQVQAQKFCYKHDLVEDDSKPYYQKGETLSGIQVFWYKRLEDVPQEFSLVLAHEFFDALPVHKLQLDKDGLWKEILIDVDRQDEKNFRFVLSKSQTPISQLYKPMGTEKRECLEYSIESERIIAIMAERLERDGGIGLIMDYGHFGEKCDTFRAFRKHALHDPLKEPGTADLTADVDFAHLRRIAEQKGQVVCFGPVEQGIFLKRMQGDVRLEKLLQNTLPENREILTSGYKMLTEPDQMGTRFKFFSIFPAVLKDHLTKFGVNGFHP